MNTVIVNFKIGNLGSILNMLKKIGATARISSDPSEIEAADRIILPGVGAFDHGMKNLSELGLVEVLNRRVLEKKVPVLGICLGMQLMVKGSEEGELQGLGWINASCRKFVPNVEQGLKVPHVGWNFVVPKSKETLFHGSDEDTRFYFTHSYRLSTDEPHVVLASTEYGSDFPSAIRANNIYGVQFHPEKSHRHGLNLLKNFLDRCP